MRHEAIHATVKIIIFSALKSTSYNHNIPTILKSMLALSVFPPLVAVQVWVPMSPEWTAARKMLLLNKFWNSQLVHVDDHW